MLVSSSWCSELERPEEVVCFLEVGPNGVDFVNEILNAGDVVFSQIFLNDFVIRNRESLLVDFAVASLVNESADVFS